MSEKRPVPRRSGAPAGKRVPGRTGSPRARRGVLWRRRAIALVVVLGLLGGAVGGVVWFVGFVRDSVTAAGAAEASRTPTGPSTTQPVACAADALAWALASEGSAAGGPVTFTVDITNLSETSCLVEGGAATLVLNVVSGSDPIWSNAHCSPATPIPLLLGPGDVTRRTITWDGARSAPGCAAVEAAVLPGTYQASLSHAGVEVLVAPLVFVLE